MNNATNTHQLHQLWVARTLRLFCAACQMRKIHKHPVSENQRRVSFCPGTNPKVAGSNLPPSTNLKSLNLQQRNRARPHSTRKSNRYDKLYFCYAFSFFKHARKETKKLSREPDSCNESDLKNLEDELQGAAGCVDCVRS